MADNAVVFLYRSGQEAGDVYKRQVLRDRKLIPHHSQAHGREDLGGDTQGTGDDGIHPGKPEVCLLYTSLLYFKKSNIDNANNRMSIMI